MMMASKDAPSNMDGTSGAGQLVPEVNAAEPLPLEPVVGAATAVATAGQVNLIDPWIMNNFVQAPEGEFTISPNNTPGDILFDLQLGPHLNPFLQHLSQMYNGWVGNMRVRVMLAGNAFTAGKIIICCVPPGFSSQNISIGQATMFPHVIADVRVLEPIEIPLDDVRNVLFHTNESRPTMRLLCMLYTPLRAGGASSGTDPFVIAGRVLTCPSPDFNFLFLVPPSVEQKTRQLTVPNIPLNNLANSRVPAMINKMTISTDQSQVVQFQNGRCTLEGQLLGTTPVSASQVARIRGKVFSTASGKGLNLTELDGTPYHAFESPAPLGFPDIGACDWHVSTFKVDQNLSGDPMSRLDIKQNAPFAPHLGSIEFTSDQEPTGDQLGTLAWVSPSTSGARVDPWKIPSYGSTVTESTHLAPPIFPPGFGEAIVYFMSDFPIVSGNTAQVPCTLPQEFVSHFVEQQAPIRGEAALLHYVDPDTHRNLGEFKLYPDGFITCVPNTGGGPQNLPINGVFVFSSWVSRYYQLKPVGTAGPARRLGVRRV
ncbi:capsid protein VP1 [Norovirus GI.7]|uniref:VP1 n=1 Tax=Norovirus GI TaxID=122928 RepID=A0A7D0Q8R8_NORV|nr:VP1 [Norovirus GI]BDA36039.1 capsid protein VP1 [Norovirus GI.7]